VAGGIAGCGSTQGTGTRSVSEEGPTRQVAEYEGPGLVNARQHLLESEASDLGAALNDLFASIVEARRSATVVLPHPQEGDPSTTDTGAWEITTPIEIPYYQTNNPSLAFTSPGNGWATVSLRANLDSEAVLIRKVPSPEKGAIGPKGDRGLKIAGFDVRDYTESTSKLIEINGTSWSQVERCRLQGARGDPATEGSSTSDLIHIRSPRAAGDSNWSQIHQNELTITAGITGLHMGLPSDNSGAAQSYVTNNRFSGIGNERMNEPAIGIHYDNSGGFNCMQNDISGCATGIKITNRIGDTIRGAGSIIGTRWEGGYGPGRQMGTPIEIEDGVRGIDIQPIRNAGRLTEQFVRNSILRGVEHGLDTIAPVVAQLQPGGAGFTGRWSPAGDRPPVKSDAWTVFLTPESANGSSRLSMGGNAPVGPNAVTRCQFVADFPSNGHADATTVRLGLRRTNGNVAMFESTGGGNWMAVTREAGDGVGDTPTDTDVSASSFRRTFTICPERDRRKRPYDYRFLVDGVEVALHEGANIGPAEPFVDVYSNDGNERQFRIRDLTMRTTPQESIATPPQGFSLNS
jgi:hypothetical protein